MNNAADPHGSSGIARMKNASSARRDKPATMGNTACSMQPIDHGGRLSRILQPFKGLGEIEFGMTLDQVKQLTGINQSSVRNKHLKQEQLADGQTVYVFENGTLVTIEAEYQPGIQFNEADIFATADVSTLLNGHEIERKRNVMHIKPLGLALFDFQSKDAKKRALWFYSKEMIPELDNLLDVV